MDFGDILDSWERGSARKPSSDRGKRDGVSEAGSGSAKQPEERAGKRENPLNVWLRRNGVYDKDREEEQRIAPGERRRRLLHKRPDAELDLHGLTQDETWSALEGFFSQCLRQGLEKILIIHGKGNHSAGEAVLRGTVKRFIENCPYAGESGHGSAKSGGTGSVWVILKPASSADKFLE